MLLGLGRRPQRRPAASASADAVASSAASASASACSSTASPGTSASAAAAASAAGSCSRPRSTTSSGPGVAALADAGALADPAAQVVELRAPDVAAGGDLDLLDLRRVHGERALDADAEGLLADREGLAHALALALDDHALEDLRAAARALDDLEVDLDAVPGLEAGDAAQLRALEGVDDGAHGVRKAARGWASRAVDHGSGPSGRAAVTARAATHRTRAWWPESSTSGTAQPRHSAGRV